MTVYMRQAYKEVRTMLGEQIGEEAGQITGMRVLPDEGTGPKVEVSFQASGTLLGAHVNNMGTYVSVARPDGTLFGDGQGVTMTDQGEAATWRGQGVGRFTGPGGAVAFRGAIYFQTTAERLARLNGMAVVFEYEADESGKTADKTYEWK
jgi:hypothetical protein